MKNLFHSAACWVDLFLEGVTFNDRRFVQFKFQGVFSMLSALSAMLYILNKIRLDTAKEQQLS